MLLSDHGIDVTVQLARPYLERVVTRELYDEGTCLGTIPASAPIPDSDGYFRTERLVFRPGAVTFEDDPEEDLTFLRLTLERVAGVLLVGETQDALAPANELELRLRVAVDQDKSDAEQVVVSMFLDPALQAMLDAFEVDAPVAFELCLDLSDFSVGDLDLTLAGDPGRVKALSDGSLALGLSVELDGQSPPGGDLQKFLDSFDIDLLAGTTRDWALAVDEWLIARFVEETIDLDDEDDLRNVDLQLERITSAGLEISGSGEAHHPTIFGDWWGFTFEAEATLHVEAAGQPDSAVRAEWEVTDVELDSLVAKILDWLFDVVEKALEKSETGSATVLPSATFGEASEPAGQLAILAVESAPGRTSFIGDSSAAAVDAPQANVEPEGVALGPACPGEDDTALVKVENPAPSGSDHAPLSFCAPAIVGPGESAFAIVSGGSGGVLDHGDQHWIEVGPVDDAASDNHSAELVLGTNAGEKRVDLELLLAEATLVGMPLVLQLFGIERRDWCGSGTVGAASEAFMVFASGGGSVRICEVELLEQTGGSWSVEGLAVGDVLATGEWRGVVVRFTPDQLGQVEQAKLRIVGSHGATNEVSLFAEVVRATTGNPPPSVGGAGLDYAAFDRSGTRVCFEIDRVGDALDGIRWERVIEDLENIWDDLPPDECCPPPVQPMCQCAQWLELELDGVPLDARVTVDAQGQTVLDMQVSAERSVLLAPVAPEARPVVRLDEVAEADARVTGSVRRWQATRAAAWTAGEDVIGVAAAAGRVGVLAGGRLAVFEVDGEDTVEQRGELRLGQRAAGVAALGSHVAVYGEDGLLLVDPHSERLAGVIEVATDAFEALIPLGDRWAGERGRTARDGSARFRFALGVRRGSFAVLDFADPRRPSEVVAQDTAVAPLLGQLLGSRLVLAGARGLEAFEADAERGLRSLGAIELPAVASMVTNGDMAWVVDRSGAGHVVDLAAGAPRTAGRLAFPEVWADVLPAGAFSTLDRRRLVAGRLLDDGFNVYRVERGRRRR